MKYKKYFLFFISLTGSLLLVSCAKSNTPAVSSIVRYQLTSAVTTLDSSLAGDTSSINTLLNVEEGLFRVNSKNEPTLALAQSYSTSKDGKTLTITLRQGLKWSNGEALTAQDFVYAWQRGADPKTSSQYAYLFHYLKNGAAVTSGKLAPSALGVSAPDSRTLVIHLEVPTPYITWLLTENVYFPLNKKFVEKMGKSYGISSAQTLYDGPYKFTDTNGWTGSNDQFHLVKNVNYYDAKAVKTPEIDIRVISNSETAANLYKSGKLDIAFLTTTTTTKSNKKTDGFIALSAPYTDYLQFNQTGKVSALTNPDIRKAIDLATDRQTIIDIGAPGAQVATGLVPANLCKAANGQDFAAYAKQPYSYDPQQAKTLWTAGLKALGKKTLTLTIQGDSDTPFAKSTLDYLSSSLAQLLPGLTVRETLLPQQQRLKNAQAGDFDMMLSSWGADYNEPSDFLNLLTTGASFNSGKFSSRVYDSAMKKATTLPDIMDNTARNTDYQTAEHTLYEAAAIDPIAFESQPALINPHIHGISTLSSELVNDLKNVVIEK